MIARLLLIALVTGSIAAHQNPCKRAMLAAFERCGYVRGRRSAPDLPGGTERRRRQIVSIREIIVSSRLPVYHFPFPSVPSFTLPELAPAVPPSPSAETSIPAAPSPKNVPVVPPAAPQLPRRFGSLPEESGSEVGFDTSYEEMAELFNELYERTPRSSRRPRADAEREFQEFRAACCRNTELCLSNEIFPCTR